MKVSKDKQIPSKLDKKGVSRISLIETCLLIRRWAVQRWHDLNMGVYTKRGNLRANDKGKYQIVGTIR